MRLPLQLDAIQQRAGLTDAEVCERGRVSLSYWKRIKREGTPYYGTARRLARVLECRVDDFFALRVKDTSSRKQRAGKRGRPRPSSPVVTAA